MRNIYNHADDNIMGCRPLTKSELCDSIRNVSKTMIFWCSANYMQANPKQFQLNIFGNFDDTGSIQVENGVLLKPLKCVNVLGVHVDHLLNFRTHVASINQKAVNDWLEYRNA